MSQRSDNNNTLNNNNNIITTNNISNASFMNATNIHVVPPNGFNTSVNLSFAVKDFKEKDGKDLKERILEDLTPRKINDTSMLNASITTSATYNNAVYHTST